MCLVVGETLSRRETPLYILIFNPWYSFFCPIVQLMKNCATHEEWVDAW